MQPLEITVSCFNLSYTLECGQCFRWEKIEENTYIGVILDRVIKIKQQDDILFVYSDKNENLEKVVRQYFDLDVDYGKIEARISAIDEHINLATKKTSGIRHLHQDFFETLISFIISANNNIPRISKSIQEIAKRYGSKRIFEGNVYYLFPSKEQLQDVSIASYRECGVGFRDRYLNNTVNELLNSHWNEAIIAKLSTEELRAELMTLQGVGQKVADCILLFGFHRQDVFPVDVWVERVMSVLYFKEAKGAMSKKEILQYANKKFGKDAGIVQQHLFFSIREGLMT